MRIGILGGTFDPVHDGHLAMARAAAAHFNLDHVLFVPAGDPWRKSTGPAARTITPAADRLEMLRLAIGDDPLFGISDIELRRDGPSYTADTLDALAGERLDDMFWLILGADALADMPHWKDPERLADHAVIAVAQRPGFDLDAAAAALPGLRTRIEAFPMEPCAHSSTAIRRRAAAGEPLDGFVPDAVAAFIRARRLYGTHDEEAPRGPA